MLLKRWNELPECMQLDEVKEYYDILSKKKGYLITKRSFDFLASLVLLLVTSPIALGVSIAIKLDSDGPVFFRQTRVTQFNRTFKIHKFRTMYVTEECSGNLITTSYDDRITKVGRFLRNTKIDEYPQLIDILEGNMSFIGTRPEVEKYVEKYTPEMMATLLLPAGVSSEASIRYKDESKLIDFADDVDQVYIEKILPAKMKYNLDSLKNIGIASDIQTMIRTVLAVIGKDY